MAQAHFAVSVAVLKCRLRKWLPRQLIECEVARWQSGYAAACKAVYAGSIPTLASIYPYAYVLSGS